MLTSNINMINNSAFASQQNSFSMISAIRSVGPNSDTNLLQASEKQLNVNKLNNDLTYNASLLMEDSQKKVNKDNIKRTFDMFA